MTRVEDPPRRQAPAEERIPRSCSDVFRLWASVGLGFALSLGFQIFLTVLEATGLRTAPSGRQLDLEFDFGEQLIAWNSFACAYLLLGSRAFSGIDRAELVRRIRGTPLPKSAVRRWLLAGGGGTRWPALISLAAFSTVVTALINKDDLTGLVLGLALFSVASTWTVLTFSFAVHYARGDVAEGGLEFSGPQEATFSDYVYLAIGCSATFGTTDTAITTRRMRRSISLHSVLAFVFNTVLIAAVLSLVTN